MSKFIEVTTVKNEKELVNTDIIELIYVFNGATYLRLKPNNSQGVVSMQVKDAYTTIKTQVLQ